MPHHADPPLTLAEGLELVEGLRRRGWCPWDSLSEECRTTTNYRPKLAHLLQRDQDGLFVVLVQRDLASRFLHGRIAGRNSARWSALWAISCAFVVRDRHGQRGVLGEVVDWTLTDFISWFADVLKPAYNRLRREGPPALEAEAEAQALPLTAVRLLHGTLESPADLRAMARGLAMHEHRTLRPKGTFLELPPGMGGDFLEFCMNRQPDVLTVRRQQISINPKSIKSALDAIDALEGVGRVSDEPTVPMKHEPESPSNLDQLEALELTELVRQIIRRRAQDARRGSGKYHVLQHFEQLLQGKLTYQELAKRVDKSPATLQEAFQLELAEVRRAVPA